MANKIEGQANQENQAAEQQKEGFAKRWLKRTGRYLIGGVVGVGIGFGAATLIKGKGKSEKEESEEESEEESSEE